MAREINSPALVARCLYNLAYDHVKCAFHSFEGALPDASSLVASVELLRESSTIFSKFWRSLATDVDRLSFSDKPDFEMTPVVRLLQYVLTQQGHHGEALEVAESARARAIELLLLQQQRRTGRLRSQQPPRAAAASSTLEQMQQTATRENATILFFSIIDTNTYVWVLPPCAHAEGEPQAAIHFYQVGVDEKTQDKEILRLMKLLEYKANNHEAKHHDECESRDVATSAMQESESEDEDKDPQTSSPIPKHPPRKQMLPAEIALEIDGLLKLFHERLITPIVGAIERNSQLLIIPEGSLFRLPFAALLDSSGSSLIERHAIRLSPSVGSVAKLGDLGAAPCTCYTRSAVVVGNPKASYPVEPKLNPLRPLAGAELEAGEVRNCLEEAGYAVTLLMGENATKDRVVGAMKSSEIIHLAMHGDGDSLYLAGAACLQLELTLRHAKGFVRFSGCSVTPFTYCTTNLAQEARRRWDGSAWRTSSRWSCRPHVWW